jgi:hypothetical protein
VRGLVLGAVQVAPVADAALERLERAAQGEQGRAQIMGDRGDHETALALGRCRAAQRVAQAAGHPVQRLADLRNLAGACRQRLDVELAAGDALGIGGQSRERLQHPTAQEHDDGGEGGGQRGQTHAKRDRPARRGALARHPELARHARERDVRFAVVR